MYNTKKLIINVVAVPNIPNVFVRIKFNIKFIVNVVIPIYIMLFIMSSDIVPKKIKYKLLRLENKMNNVKITINSQYRGYLSPYK